MIEYESVLNRADHLRASGLQTRDIGALLDGIAGVADRVHLAFLWRPFLPDPHDDIVLETAINGHADVLVTLNRRHFAPAATSFRIAILSPEEAIGRMRRET